MIGLYINPRTNDLELDEGGSLRLARGREAIAQHARQRVLSHAGEWFLDVEAGIPWLDQILGRGYAREMTEALVKAEIAGTPGIRSIESVSASFDPRTRRINLRAMDITTQEDGD